MNEAEEKAVRDYILLEYMQAMVGNCLRYLKASPITMKTVLERVVQSQNGALVIEQKQVRRDLSRLNIWIVDEGRGNYLVKSRGRSEPYRIEREEARLEIAQRFGEYAQVLDDFMKQKVSL